MLGQLNGQGRFANCRWTGYNDAGLFNGISFCKWKA